MTKKIIITVNIITSNTIYKNMNKNYLCIFIRIILVLLIDYDGEFGIYQRNIFVPNISGISSSSLRNYVTSNKLHIYIYYLLPMICSFFYTRKTLPAKSWFLRHSQRQWRCNVVHVRFLPFQWHLLPPNSLYCFKIKKYITFHC